MADQERQAQPQFDQKSRSRTRNGRSSSASSASPSNRVSRRNRRTESQQRRADLEKQVAEDNNRLPGIGEVFNPEMSAATKAKRRDELYGAGEQEDNDNPLRLRLDVNLDVAIELKAQVHGDVTLQLLG